MALRHLTHLAEPQSAAGDSSLVPGGWADQPRLAGMVVLRRQLTFSSINLFLFNCARCLSVLFWAFA